MLPLHVFIKYQPVIRGYQLKDNFRHNTVLYIELEVSLLGEVGLFPFRYKRRCQN